MAAGATQPAVRPGGDRSDAAQGAAIGRRGLGLNERDLLKRPWLMGERYTICDPYLFTLAQWLEAEGVDVAKLPRVREHSRRMAVRAALRQEVG